MSGKTTSRVSRRGFLAGIGTTAAAAVAVPQLVDTGRAAAATLGGRAVGAAAAAAANLALEDIQGNILGGFNKDFQTLLVLAAPNGRAGRGWLAELLPSVASAQEVAAFNVAFKAARARTGSEQTTPTATWVNVALTHAGLAALEVPKRELDAFPDEFRAGMAARADLIGDQGPNAPGSWPAPYRRRAHALVIVAADRASDLAAEVRRQQALAAKYRVEVLVVQQGATRADEPGHEHFGFRDGISQPGVRGFTVPSDPAGNPDQGVPGQDLLWPGEFIIGQPRQPGVGGGSGPGPVARSGPDWAVNGSYLVFRRLRQDVAGFRAFVASLAAGQGISEDLAGAKIVGRYCSGAPLERTGAKATDPGIADPSLLADNVVNDFEFGDDPDGAVVPLAAHIRKTYPRDEPTRDGGEADTQTHRLLRRGIPFGASLGAGAPASQMNPAFPDDRGLLFLCYQTSIARQFEFVQRRWVNDPAFPSKGAGVDPVISQVDGSRTFGLPGGRPDHVALLQRFVTTTGGDYFFQPSRSALRRLAQV